MSEVNLGGCPPKYTPERTSAILKSISNRIPYELAAEANGISERCLYLWLNKGEEESEVEDEEEEGNMIMWSAGNLMLGFLSADGINILVLMFS